MGRALCLLVFVPLLFVDVPQPDLAATPRAQLGWSGATSFYQKSGWEICREYAPFQKNLRK